MDECEFYEFDGICSKCLPHELLCSQINGCTYKQLLAEQDKNSELEATLNILKINHKLTISELNNEQAKNKKLVNLIEIMCYDDWEDMTVFKFQKQMIKALNEVNNEK